MPQVLQLPRPPDCLFFSQTPPSCPHTIASRSQNIVESCLSWIPRGGTNPKSYKKLSSRWNVGAWKIIQKVSWSLKFECKNLFESRIEVLWLKNLWFFHAFDPIQPNLFSLKENILKPTREHFFQVHTCWQATFIAIPFQSQAMLCIARTFHYKARPCATMGHGNVRIKPESLQWYCFFGIRQIWHTSQNHRGTKLHVKWCQNIFTLKTLNQRVLCELLVLK